MTALEFSTEIQTSQKELFDFHMDFSNVRIVTPSIIKTRFIKIPEEMKAGSSIVVEVNQFGFWLPWDILVEEVVPHRLLVDVQKGRGPFQSWRHEHRFDVKSGITVLTDRIEYQLPFGPLGSLFDRVIMRFLQRRIFAYRHKKTKEHFLNR